MIIEELITHSIFFIVESSIGFRIRIESIAFYFRRYQRVFAKVFIILMSRVVSRNDEAATPINTWPVVNVSWAPGLCLFTVSSFLSRLPLFLLFVRKFLPKTDITETTKDPFIVATARLFDQIGSSRPTKRTSVYRASILPSLRPFLSLFKKDNFLDGIAVVLHLGISVSFSNPLPYWTSVVNHSAMFAEAIDHSTYKKRSFFVYEAEDF